MLIEVKDRNDLEAMLEGEERQVLLLSTETCPACRMSRAAALEYAKENTLYAVDLNVSPALARLLSVRSVPTLLAFEGRREVARHTGRFTRQTLTELSTRVPSGTP